MGIKGLTPFLRRFAPSALRTLPVAELAGTRVAVDGDQTLWRLFHGYNFAGNSDDRRFLWGFRRLVGSMRAKGIEPIVVFDAGSGLGPRLKSREHRIRSAKRDAQFIRSEALKRAATLLAVVADGIERGKIDAASSALERLRELFAEPVKLSRSAEAVLAARVRDGRVVDHARLANPTAESPWLPEKSASPTQVREVLMATGNYLEGAMDNFQKLYTNVSDGSVSKALKKTATDLVDELNGIASKLVAKEATVATATKDMPLETRQNLADHLRYLSDTQYNLSQTLSSRVTLPPRMSLVRPLQDMLRLMGVQIHTAPPGHEGECLAASLCSVGIAKGGVMSTDTDSILYGLTQTRGIRLVAPPPTPKIGNNGNNNGLPDKLDMLDVNAALNELGLSPSQFLDLCLLLGTDFAPTLPGVGQVKALKLIKEYGSVQGILDSGVYYNAAFEGELRDRTLEAFDEARELFGRLVDVSGPEYQGHAVLPSDTGMESSREFLVELSDKLAGHGQGDWDGMAEEIDDVELDGAYQRS